MRPVCSLTSHTARPSGRTPLHVIDAARYGANIATIPYKIILQMAIHPLTDAGIEKFMHDWENRK